MATKGFFILTDISGYTEYLTESELEHAHQALQSLFDVQLANTNFPLTISGFRGDAIFMYTPEAGFINPQSFLETLKNLYIVFSDILSYALFSEAAAQSLNLQYHCDPLTPHKEKYEHLSEVNMLAHNLKSAWEWDLPERGTIKVA